MAASASCPCRATSSSSIPVVAGPPGRTRESGRHKESERAELMQNIANLDGLVPDSLQPRTRKIVLEDYRLDLDIGFHDFEIGNPQRLLVTIEVWVDERGFAAGDEAGRAWDYDFLRTEIGALVAGRRFNLQETVVRVI